MAVHPLLEALVKAEHALSVMLSYHGPRGDSASYAQVKAQEALDIVADLVHSWPKTTGEEFEDAIRQFGVVPACEWFGHMADSEFTEETTRVLYERARSKT